MIIVILSLILFPIGIILAVIGDSLDGVLITLVGFLIILATLVSLICWPSLYCVSYSNIKEYQAYKQTIEQEYKDNYASATALTKIANVNGEIASYKAFRHNVWTSWFVYGGIDKIDYIKINKRNKND
jgi:hypothetical protein